MHTKTYLLSLVIRSINDSSQAFIFTVLMPVMNSLMVLILSSVRAAVLLLRGQTWDEPQWPQPNFPQQQQGVQGGTKDRWFPTALLCWHHRRTFSKCKWRKILLGSQPVSLIQEVTWRTPSTGWGRPEVSQVQSLRLRSQLSREGKRHWV